MGLLLRLAMVLVLLGAPIGLAAEPLSRSVLIIDQTDPNSAWGLEFRAVFRRTLEENARSPVAIYSEVLDLTRFHGPDYEKLLHNYLREKYREKPIGAVVVHGSTALDLFLRLRPELWPTAPVVFAVVDVAALARLSLPKDVTGTTIELSVRNALDSAKLLVPGLRRLALVGDPWERQAFRSHYKQELSEIKTDVEFIDLTGLPMEELKRRLASLPDDTAIYYTSLYVDGAGNTFVPSEVVSTVAEAAARPVVVDSLMQFGSGSVGGLLNAPQPAAEETAHIVTRIFNGESPAQIPIKAGNVTKPIFDWRQLQRFNISEKNLPPGSEIRFRRVSLWDQYRTQVILTLLVVLLQSAMITGLLIERHRRRAAELESRERFIEMARMDRALTAGAMSSSIAHELNQPLGAILSNAEAAEALLASNAPDLEQIKLILDDIRRDDQRAVEIIRHVRGLLRKRHDVELKEVDLNLAIQSAVQILSPEATRRGVVLNANQMQGLLRVRADQVQLEQVILNLAMNGMDAMQTCPPGKRTLSLETALNGDSQVEVSVADTGTGIPNDKLKNVFETFYTTKQQGSGLGLSVARTIIETYRGKIWAENRPGGGAIFRFSLPLTSAGPT